MSQGRGEARRFTTGTEENNREVEAPVEEGTNNRQKTLGKTLATVNSSNYDF
jgi:hypothetical protein